MNPQDPLNPQQSSDQPELETPVIPTETEQTQDLSSDASALQQIDAIESESTDPSVAAAASLASTDRPASSFEPAQPSIDTNPQPSFEQPSSPASAAPVPEQPESPVVAAPTPNVAPQPSQPVAPASFPQPPEKKKSNKLLIGILVAILVIAGAATGYFVWQSTQTANNGTNQAAPEQTTPEQTGGDLPGGEDVQVDTQEAPVE